MRYLKKATPQPIDDVSSVRETVSEMLSAIENEGDAALHRYSQRLDHWAPPSFKLSHDDIRALEKDLPSSFVDDAKFAHAQIQRFAQMQFDNIHDFEAETIPGVWLGQKSIPVCSVGAYVPGGRYPMLSCAPMSIIPARVAGVKRVIAATPPSGADGPNPFMVYTVYLAGADEIYCLGGVQAVAALALGTETIQAADMLVGPGNAYVAEAKRQLFGRVGIDLVAGPSEILVIADEHADAALVAADLLAQAEHGPTSPSWLVTTSDEMGRRVLEEISIQLQGLSTVQVAGAAWNNFGEVVVVDSDEEAVEVADTYAPEHLEVQTQDWQWYLERLQNYGSLFLGEMATVAYGDKTVGTNHILPTIKNARFTGGLWVGKFLKTVTYQHLDRRGTQAVAPVVSRQSELEGFAAHQASADRRLAKYGMSRDGDRNPASSSA
ncbi:MAG: histidinol dehydrogenase [Chloroflexota bacterium]